MQKRGRHPKTRAECRVMVEVETEVWWMHYKEHVGSQKLRESRRAAPLQVSERLY